MSCISTFGVVDTYPWLNVVAASFKKARVACAVLLAALLVAGCAQTPSPAPGPAQTLGSAPPAATPTAPSIVTPPTVSPSDALASAPPTSTPPTDAASRGTAAVDPRKVATLEALTPAGRARYSCEKQGVLTDIQLPEGSGRICSRFPAMGPCQYERNACRARGGRVIRFDGVEITRDVEREYDKQVQRYRLNAG